ncbi:hypothetical protein GLOIN_2v1582265 [Rhizophagus irregularis DAOM 181602=DAOM 197198]|uniref:Uncharacterized protein n=1 Tax=Rhizophagus irregularis (strain DAOM 181602 / DAOM 197198 / MUCL 43194) TaxID=747089 RepID=A0A2P4Q7W8_RHIID|nr:hypothetical protein GLOIN_2v1582265 [Rhizophagus irregularis DAOM 181602=DAOM 197198]POG73734.1 hypothetical protein GLOIN_2v1582265 [Rhizophagus irregularis DAOM 181602=DAOM 197198]|eukprot:XP_025180600.1 hypothetical protein GLOIN_2v1582265 [Rhizophagus irregularis DAOM 181602=DAOM 197198]
MISSSVNNLISSNLIFRMTPTLNSVVFGLVNSHSLLTSAFLKTRNIILLLSIILIFQACNDLSVIIIRSTKF